MQVFLATPAYDGKVVPQFEESLKGSLRILVDAGIPCHWEVLSGCCYLPIARNKLAKKFLGSGMTDMVFLDADVAWDPEDLIRLLSWPVDIVAGAYRHKTWEETYPVWYRTGDDNRPILGGLSDLIACWSVPTGFMKISRQVFEAMDKHYGESLEIDEYDNFANLKNTYQNYFDTIRHDRQWWGEDVNFCRRWTMEMGRALWVDPHIVLSHWGTATDGRPIDSKGSFHEYLMRLPGGFNDPGYHDNGIDGFSVVKELQWLFSTSKEMNSIVEIGSHLGRSSHALLTGCSGVVTCVDSWEPTEWIEEDSKEKSYARYRAFMENTSSFSNRAVLKMKSPEAANIFPDGSVDMVFIDGNHGRESVVADLDAWTPKARKIICGHDYNCHGWPEVKEIIDSRFGDKVQTCGTIWFVEL